MRGAGSTPPHSPHTGAGALRNALDEVLDPRLQGVQGDEAVDARPRHRTQAPGDRAPCCRQPKSPRGLRDGGRGRLATSGGLLLSTNYGRSNLKRFQQIEKPSRIFEALQDQQITYASLSPLLFSVLRKPQWSGKTRHAPRPPPPW